ncbi:hypothetical protein CRG98_044717 [Punica granatum]|uniref:Uncharacterized protein n=1 Tax=Punica granatum TaxID=22663 RepID=A0A2I0HT32_PUNGR|nr:hypothetical protein CRG98_044717 [Punica granatum]
MAAGISRSHRQPRGESADLAAARWDRRRKIAGAAKAGSPLLRSRPLSLYLSISGFSKGKTIGKVRGRLSSSRQDFTC